MTADCIDDDDDETSLSFAVVVAVALAVIVASIDTKSAFLWANCLRSILFSVSIELNFFCRSAGGAGVIDDDDDDDGT